MSARALTFDLGSIESAEDRARTRRSMALSVAFHAALLLAIVLAKPAERARETLTEITLLGPGGLEAAGDPAPRPAARAPQTVAGAAVAAPREEHFRRELTRGDVDPVPQSSDVAVDRLNARLAAIRTDQPAIASDPALGAPRGVWSAPAAAVGPGGSGASPIALHRGGGGGTAPLPLARGGGGSALVPAGAVGGMPATGAGDAPAAAEAGEATARRTLAGASLAGPIADRAVVRSVMPVYPDWAKRDAVEGSVTLYFVVRADGTVKENVLVQKTAGFGDFDDNARVALRDWRFEPLRGGRTGEQWGTITFHYRLRGA